MSAKSTPTPPHADLGQRIRMAREQSGMLQPDLARKLKCSTRSVSNWETGWFKPRPPMMAKLAKATGREMAWFYSENGQVAA